MRHSSEASSWFESSTLETSHEFADKPQEFERLWRGLMTARVTLGLVLLVLQSAIYVVGPPANGAQVLICAGYFAVALAVRLVGRARALGKTFDAPWIASIGVDILAFAALQAVQGHNVNYAPLFALPILMTAVLGSLLLAMGVAAGVTLLLFVFAGWMSLQQPTGATTYFFQAALTGTGYFVMSFLANQIATRLANVEVLAQRNQWMAKVQRQVNELVIAALPDGILVVNPRGTVRSANPAARLLLGAESALKAPSFELSSQTGWQGLVDLMAFSFSAQSAQQAEISIHHAGQGNQRVRVRTQLTARQKGSSESLCVMFIQDQREMEARMRTEKLASMGRMSAAVAHEIRNPLAAIAQANALLDEDLSEPRHKQLTQMVQKNAKRLEKIVDDVLNIARLQHPASSLAASPFVLNAGVGKICADWQAQTSSQRRLRVDLSPRSRTVCFDTEHLHRVLVNLLDNAQRYASPQRDAIQVTTGQSSGGQSTLSVWSDGPPMDTSVERHLFEPFFSSESRSSGLGLYICRALCEGHGAVIGYHRTSRYLGGQATDGNEFLITLRIHQHH